MRVSILGSAAGGGFPQWNCSCRNCSALRAGTFRGSRRSQTQVAVSQDGQSWFLLNASPDLRQQIEACPALHPSGSGRGSPIAGVVLTSADLDQVVGLLSLRELQPFRIYCTPSVRRILREDNNVFAMLNRVPEQVFWMEIRPGESFPLASSGLCCAAFSLGGCYPAYVSSRRVDSLQADEGLLGLMVTSSSGRTLAYLPTVPEVDQALRERLEAADLVLFDGTFWTDDELIRVQGDGATARQMGHIPVSGSDGGLRQLDGLRHPRKVLVHVNNTNPMLDESGPEYAQVRAAGWEIAEDGWSIEL